MKHLKSTILILILWAFALVAKAQITGVVLDEATGDSIPFASVAYKTRNIATSCNSSGHFSIKRHNGLMLTISAVGYKPYHIDVNEETPHRLTIRMRSGDNKLNEVVIKSKKSKYSRKNNPAVELMKRVIAAKRRNKLENKDFYSYDNYEKLTLSLNRISPEALNEGFISKRRYMRNQVEESPLMTNLSFLSPSQSASPRYFTVRTRRRNVR